MNLYSKLQERALQDKPVRVGLIGAGKFCSMFLAQVPSTAGLRVSVIADLLPDRAKLACKRVGWNDDRIAATRFVEDGSLLCASDDVDVVVDSTGSPGAGVVHALAAIEYGKHIVMVNVEADVLAGPALAARARKAGVVYSMAYGDQPALISEMVDWARAAGFIVQAAGKGTKYLPGYNLVTPDDVWKHYGITAESAEAAGMNSQMFNSFLDGTKSAIEMAAVANSCALNVPDDGLSFLPCGVDDLSRTLRPVSAGGQLAGEGMVEVISSMERDGRPVFRDLRWGVYVVLKAPNDYSAACFAQYGLPVHSTGQYAAMYKPFHLIGMELGISILSAALRHEPTGHSRQFRGDAVATAKRNLAPGDMLDGEGGYTVWGKLMPAARSVEARALPIGLAHGVKVTKPIKVGEIISRDAVEALPDNPALRLRLETQAMAG
ncbi:NAD(P)H-dependent oxidoreductase [Aestuariivirga sp.]|uniref:NAD(P)H-dependent oxidoreductase n=1 Tax=Aestuariivirga sp. TaxID=2650926 RepID=UPI0037851176